LLLVISIDSSLQELEVIVKFYVNGIIVISPILVFAREYISEQFETNKI
jgi:hypothetical protein